MHSPHCAPFLLFLLLFLSVGSGGVVSRKGGCGSGAHGGGSVGASHGGRVPRTFSIVKEPLLDLWQYCYVGPMTVSVPPGQKNGWW